MSDLMRIFPLPGHGAVVDAGLAQAAPGRIFIPHPEGYGEGGKSLVARQPPGNTADISARPPFMNETRHGSRIGDSVSMRLLVASAFGLAAFLVIASAPAQTISIEYEYQKKT
jgi:hypothetical protein